MNKQINEEGAALPYRRNPINKHRKNEWKSTLDPLTDAKIRRWKFEKKLDICTMSKYFFKIFMYKGKHGWLYNGETHPISY